MARRSCGRGAVRCGSAMRRAPRFGTAAASGRAARARRRARGGNRALPLARRAAGFYRCETGRCGAKCAAEPRASFPRLSACPILECSIQAPLCMPDSHARFACPIRAARRRAPRSHGAKRNGKPRGNRRCFVRVACPARPTRLLQTIHRPDGRLSTNAQRPVMIGDNVYSRADSRQKTDDETNRFAQQPVRPQGADRAR